jgi:hypothetical protein
MHRFHFCTEALLHPLATPPAEIEELFLASEVFWQLGGMKFKSADVDRWSTLPRN